MGDYCIQNKAYSIHEALEPWDELKIIINLLELLKEDLKINIETQKEEKQVDKINKALGLLYEVVNDEN